MRVRLTLAFSALAVFPLASIAHAQFQPQPGVEYSIRSVESGKVVDVSGASTDDGAAVFQWTWGNGANQKWRFVRLPPPEADCYRIVAVHSRKVLDVSGAGLEDGVAVIQWTWGAGENQKWRILDGGNGTVLLQAKHSGKVLDLAAGSHDDGARLQQWTQHGGPNQRWILRRESVGLVMNPNVIGAAIPAPPGSQAKSAKMFRIPQTLLNRPIIKGGVLQDTLAVGNVSLAPGTSVATRVKRLDTVQGTSIIRQFDYAYVAPNDQGEVLDLRPVLRRETQGMRLAPDGAAYRATIYVALRDEKAPTQHRDTPPGAAIQVFADGAEPAATTLVFPKTNDVFQPVQLTSNAPRDQVIVTLVPNFSDTGPADTVPVYRPRLILLDPPRSMPGWGAGAATIKVGLSEDAGTREWSASFSGRGLSFSPATIHLTRDSIATTTVRSVGLGDGNIRVSSPVLGADDKPVTLEFPGAFLLASAIGGALGSALRVLMTKSRSVKVLRNHFLAGILMGLVVAGLFILGVNITTVPLATQDNPLAVALISVIGSIGLIVLFSRLAGVKKLLED